MTSCQNNSVLVPPGAIGGIAAQGISSYVLSGPRSTVLAFDPRTGQIISTGDLFSGTYAYVLTANLVQGDTYTAYISLLVFCGGTSVAFTMPTYSFTVSCSPLPQRVGIVLVRLLGSIRRIHFSGPIYVRTVIHQVFSLGLVRWNAFLFLQLFF